MRPKPAKPAGPAVWTDGTRCPDDSAIGLGRSVPGSDHDSRSESSSSAAASSTVMSPVGDSPAVSGGKTISGRRLDGPSMADLDGDAGPYLDAASDDGNDTDSSSASDQLPVPIPASSSVMRRPGRASILVAQSSMMSINGSSSGFVHGSDSEAGYGDDDSNSHLVRIDELNRRLQTSEAQREMANKRAATLQAQLDTAEADTDQLEARMHELAGQVASAATENSRLARLCRQAEADCAGEQRTVRAEQELAREREAQLRAIVDQLKVSLALRDQRDGRRVRRPSSGSGACPVCRPGSGSTGRDNSSSNPSSTSITPDSEPTTATVLLQKDRLIEALRLDLADAQHRLAAADPDTTTARLALLERDLLEARALNSRLAEDNESYQLLLSERTLNGDFAHADFFRSSPVRPVSPAGFAVDDTSSILASLADELEQVQSESDTYVAELDEDDVLAAAVAAAATAAAAAEATSLRELQTEIGKLRDTNKALTLYINEILERILNHHQAYDEVAPKEPAGSPAAASARPAADDGAGQADAVADTAEARDDGRATAGSPGDGRTAGSIGDRMGPTSTADRAGRPSPSAAGSPPARPGLGRAGLATVALGPTAASRLVDFSRPADFGRPVVDFGRQAGAGPGGVAGSGGVGGIAASNSFDNGIRPTTGSVPASAAVSPNRPKARPQSLYEKTKSLVFPGSAATTAAAVAAAAAANGSPGNPLPGRRPIGVVEDLKTAPSIPLARSMSTRLPTDSVSGLSRHQTSQTHHHQRPGPAIGSAGSSDPFKVGSTSSVSRTASTGSASAGPAPFAAGTRSSIFGPPGSMPGTRLSLSARNLNWVNGNTGPTDGPTGSERPSSPALSDHSVSALSASAISVSGSTVVGGRQPGGPTTMSGSIRPLRLVEGSKPAPPAGSANKRMNWISTLLGY